jgi:spore maturation protein CgeB
MRVLIADTYYDAFLAQVYARRPELAGAPYEDQHRELMSLRFGTSDAYSHNLGLLGHRSTELVVNCPQLQAAWARERGLRAMAPLLSAGGRARRLALIRIAFAQIRAWRPDIVYVQDLWFFPPPALSVMHRHARLVAGQIASPAPPTRVVRGYDLIVTSFPHFVDRFRAEGTDAEYLPLAFDARVLQSLREEGLEPSSHTDRPLVAAFVGGLDPRVHARGTRLLERACEVVDLAVWGYGADSLPHSSPLRSHYQGEAWGLDMYRVLARARIVVNRHIDAAEGYANNMRLYETTGVGAMLLTDGGRNLPELFEPGREVVAYDGENGLAERLAHLAEHDDERQSIAAAGQRRTLRLHTYEQRMAQLAAILEARS